MNEFLKVEYEQCISLLRYYDERHLSLVKFAAALGSAVPSLLLTVYQLGGNVKDYFWDIAALVTSLSALSLLIVFVCLVELRKYFVRPVKQVNSIRDFYLKQTAGDFKNYMYRTGDFSTFHLFSTQTLLMLFVAFEVGVFCGLTVFALRVGSNESSATLVLMSAGCTLAVTAAIFIIAAMHLSGSPKHPND